MLKRRLAGTRIGGMAIDIRSRLELIGGALTNSIAVGDMRNNALAGWLCPRLCRPNMTFVDVGAHIGSVIGQAVRNGADRVVAFEAIPAKAEWLRSRYPWATIHNYALLDYDGETTFFIDNTQSGYSSLIRHDGDVTEISVQVRRMDTVLDLDNIDVIKVDVEGAELGVFMGAEQVIARSRPIIMFESGPQVDFGYTKESIWAWFDDRDYLIYFPDRITRAARAIALDVFLDSHEYPRRTMNYFAIPKEKLTEVSARARRLLNDPPRS